MIGIEYDFPVKDLRNKLLFEHKMFTGVAGANTIRLLPSLALGKTEADLFLEALKKEVSVAAVCFFLNNTNLFLVENMNNCLRNLKQK